VQAIAVWVVVGLFSSFSLAAIRRREVVSKSQIISSAFQRFSSIMVHPAVQAHNLSPPDAAEQIVNDFWAGIRGGDLNALVQSTRDELRALCPVIDTFSFDIVDEDPQVGATARESPIVSVDPGTPRPVVASWNEDKLVGLFSYSAELCCGAAVGNDITQAVRDFKACCLPLSGEAKCTASTHVGAKVKRIMRPVGEFVIAIAVPSSTGVKQIFSRPVLDESDMRFLIDKPEWSDLMSIKMEPRVWKLLFELFPGSYVLAEQNQVFLQGKPKPPPLKTTGLHRPMNEPVTSAPINSPRAAGGSNPQSFQTSTGEGWNFEDDNISGAVGGRGTAGSGWASNFQRPDSPASSGGSHQSSVHPPSPPEDWESVVAELRATVQRVTADADILRKELDLAFKAAGEQNAALLERLHKTEEALRHVRGQSGVSSGPLPLASADFDQLVERITLKLSPLFCTVQQFNTLSASVPSADLNRRVTDCEGELFNSAGLVHTLEDRVRNLEAARNISAIEVGGFVFVNEAATEAWVRTHNDPDLHRFVPDFLSLFLLADPKFETVEGGLDKMAAVAKAQFSSLDVATIGLSFSIIYPPNMLKKTDKAEAQLTDGLTWAGPFGTCDVFEGEFNNGTHLRLKRELSAVGKSIESGIEYYFPANTHPKTNAVFKTHARLSLAQCLEFLDSLIPLYKQISGGGMSAKESWSRVMVYVKQIFDDVRTVRSPNSAASTGSYVWAAFRTAQLLKEYQRHNWVEHPKTSSILALTSMRKEGKAIEELASKVQGHTTMFTRVNGDIKKCQEEMKDLKKKNPSLL
jgi:hypothetical protein